MDNQSDFVMRYVAAGGSIEAAQSIEAKMIAKSTAPDSTKITPEAVIHVPETEQIVVPATTLDLFGLSPEQTSPDAKKTKARRGRPTLLTAAPPTPRENELFQLSLEIDDKPAIAGSPDQGFLATALVYASLPHSEFKGSCFERRNGPYSIAIINRPSIGLPYGKIPRVICAYLCSEAKRTKDRKIYLGQSQAEFVTSRLGFYGNGGEGGALSRIKEQAKRLFTSSISLVYDGEHADGMSTMPDFGFENIQIAKKGYFLWDSHDPFKKSKWESYIVLSEDFFESCINHSMPLDMRVIHALRSPMSIDIYIWLCYRFNSVSKPTRISWRQLKWQFGSDYADTPKGLTHFKETFKKSLRQVLAIYRDAKVDPTQDYLILHPSKPHVLP